MKTKNILAAMLLMACTNVMADGISYLTVAYDGSEISYSLPVVQKIYFRDGNVIVLTNDGEQSFPITILEKMTFTETATAIEALPEQEENMTFEDGKLHIKGDGLLRIYSTGGQLVNIANIKEGANINLGNLPKGIYVVRMGDKTIKVKN